MQLFYTPDICETTYTFNPEESHHCVKVLRLRTGDTLHLTDGRGTLFAASLTDPNPRACTVKVTSRTLQYGQLPYALHLAVAPTKNTDRFEWLLEKCTEIGTNRFIPMCCDHSERKILKPERCEKVITSAVKQSLKAYHPTLDPLTPFSDILKNPFPGAKFIAHCEEERPRILLKNALKEALLKEPKNKNLLILIGPEGDFSSDEIAAARQNGFVEVSLGSSRLRTETAGVVACTTVALLFD